MPTSKNVPILTLTIMLSLSALGCATNAGRALKQVRKADPLTDREGLQARLGVSTDRLATIVTGPEGKSDTIDVISASVDTRFVCVPGGNLCFCVGDADCNLMFTADCADPATGGTCVGEFPNEICTCHPNG